ncbi:RNA polymerase sigma-70 factor (ECF subfamily) [Pseudorhizobium tarimense]|uniref:RNA polymerase sigma-70 factor (ECF subfamily) n=1 Tax=Pseudorhizobium tarimense TaxID=1079109 RepID=A0ABV2H0K2_9HYPH|nr:sigma-70 family RNA polymerase sigma factor [Pseudorhizobium tarimense]MCJ8517409.1 sigma-70 family RNA polymerase sigma factor [Pseudorhizobium tarimense]
MTDKAVLAHLQVEVLQLVPALRSFARRFYPNPHDVDDLVQETLLRAFANLDKFRPGTSLKSWMFTIMRNTFCTRYGQGKREFVGIEDCASLHRAIDAPQEWSVRAHEFQRALADLPEHYRDAFETVLMRGESYEQAALRCNCPIGTIKSRVNRARSAILKSLGEDGVKGTMGIQ